MGIELSGDEGEVVVVDYSAAAEVTAETTEPAAEETVSETTAAETEAIKEVVEDMTTEPVDDNQAGETEVYSQEEVVELMKIHEEKLLAEIARGQMETKAAPAETQTTERPAAKAPSELVAGTLDEVLAGVGDEDLVSGKDIKEILKKSFAALNNKAEEFNNSAEAVKFDNAVKLYAERYVPNIVQNYKLDPTSRDARFIQSSFLETLTHSMHRFGRTEAAAKAAATQHMLNMSKEFGEVKPTVAAAKPAVIIEKKLASGNTGAEPAKAKTAGVDPGLLAKLESGKASTAQLLQLINARK